MARASAVTDARQLRTIHKGPVDVSNMRGHTTNTTHTTNNTINIKKNKSRTITTKTHTKLRVATLNTGTLSGRFREIAAVLEERRVDICCMQETKWVGSKAYAMGSGYKLIYHGKKNEVDGTQYGVGIALSPSLVDAVTDTIPISDRILAVRVEFHGNSLFVVSAYAPQTGRPQAEKEAFYTQLNALLDKKRDDERLLLGGDFNGHVGTACAAYKRNHGGRATGSLNDDGIRILELAAQRDLAVVNTFFRKRLSHLLTYASGGRSTQIDFWLVQRELLNDTLDCKVIPSDNVTTQHHPLVMDLRLRQRHQPTKTNETSRIRWWKTKDKDTHTLLALRLNHRLTAPILYNTCPNTVDDYWTLLRESITTLATDTLGKTKPGRKRIMDKDTWFFTEHVQEAVRKKKKALKKARMSRLAEDWRQYKERKSEAKRAVAKAKSDATHQFYKDLDGPGGEKSIYRLAKARHAASKAISHARIVKSKDGDLLRDNKQILDRWREHFDTISNVEFPHPPLPPSFPIAGPVAPITASEVEQAIRAMKTGKACGPDDIPSEAWKMLAAAGVEHITRLLNCITAEGKIPSDWNSSVTVPIFKGKGDVADCGSYRPIRLLCQTMKIFERIIDSRLREIVDLRRGQCGFRKGCGTTDAIFALRDLLEKHRRLKDKPLHLCFLDLEKAFDRVPHALIWHCLRGHGVPEEYINWIRMMYKEPTSRVRCAAGLSDSFPVTVGVHQGSALSPLLFIVVMDFISRDLHTPPPHTLLYADDVVIGTETRGELETLAQAWHDRLARYGLRLNIAKTEYLEFAQVQTPGTIRIDGKDLVRTTEFKYLGALISSQANLKAAVAARVNAAWMKWKEVTGVLCDRRMPERLKSKIYRTVVRPVALYGMETLPATDKSENLLHVMEMKMLRWSLGKTRLDKVRNVDVRRQLGVRPITDKTRERRTRWYGHVLRRPPEEVVSLARNTLVPGAANRGRPKAQWKKTIENDLTALKLRDRDAMDRAKWRLRTHHADPAAKRD